MKPVSCPTCGSLVLVKGKTTKYYQPVGFTLEALKGVKGVRIWTDDGFYQYDIPSKPMKLGIGRRKK